MVLQLRILGQDPPLDARSGDPPLPSPRWGETGPAWLAYGFRPFFLGGALVAPWLVLVWLAEFLYGFRVAHPVSGLSWHSHEMIYGFAAAVVAGFLLTAVPNWTGIPTPRGATLGGLFLLWLVPRIGLVLAPPHVLPALAGLDLAFFPALAVALARPLIGARKPQNLVFLPVLLALSAGNGLFWAQALGYSSRGASLSWELGLGLLLLLISVIGGRVIPFFISRALPESRTRSFPWVEALAAPIIVLAVGLGAWGASPVAYAACALLAGAVHLVRLYGWGHPRLWRVPLLWVLYVGYGFLGLGFLLRAAAALQWLPAAPALHAHTVGCISVMILGMMARVALGHTGRELTPAPVTVAAFALLIGGAVARTLLPLLAQDSYRLWVSAAGGLWALAFLLYAAVYLPILVRPRVDGKPG